MDRIGRRDRFAPKLIALAVASCFATSAAIAAQPVLPTGGTPVVGIQSITQIDRTLNVLTNAQRSIAHWNSFSIGADAAVRIQQPSAGSAHLSRVIGQDPSAILGSLWSNGRVFLVNPNGILFGTGAQINVAGLVATSLNLSNSDFLADRLNFTGGQGAGSVVNQGNITTGTGGSVYLVGPAVTNSGIITTPQGEVVLAAGNSVELVNPGTPNLSVEISAPDNQARNLGQIIADAGRIGIYAGLITNSGTVRADSAVSEGGRILLKGTKSVVLEDSSVLSAQGQGGGEIKVLAEDFVRVAGRLDASAPNGGDGGFIETSASKVTIDHSAIITTAAPFGKTGTWLIDPANFHIAPSETGDIDGGTLSINLNNNNVVIHSVDGTIDPNGGGHIYVDDTVLWTSNNSLMLVAEGDVYVNQYLSTTGTGSIKLYSGWDGQGHPLTISSTPAVPNFGSIYLNAQLTTSGDVLLVSGGSINQTALGVIDANGLLADGRYGVHLNGATNRVNTLAGRAAEGDFHFTNGKALTVGTVGPLSGITAGPGCCDTNVSVTVTSGDLTVNNNITATGGNSDGIGDANINLVTQGGSIFVQNGAVVSAIGASVPAEWDFDGGWAYVELSATNGSVTVADGSRIEASGGTGSITGRGEVELYAGISPTSNISVSNSSSIRADGAEGSIYLNATNISVINSTLEAIGDGTRATCCGSQIMVSAGGVIDTSGSTLHAVDPAGDARVYLYGPGNITLGNLVTDTLGSVYVQSGGSIMDGNSGLNVQSPYAYLYAANGIGTIANPLETLVAGIYLSSSSGEIGIINSDNLVLNSLYLGSGNSAVGATGTMTVAYPGSVYVGGGNLSLIANGLVVNTGAYSSGDMVLNGGSGDLNIMPDGGEGLSSGANMFLLGNNVNVGNPSGLYSTYVNANGFLSVSTPGNFTVQGGSGAGALTYAAGYTGVGVNAGGNVMVTGGSGSGAYAYIMGSPDVVMNVGGTVQVNPNKGSGAPAWIESGLPATIYLNFPNNTSGDGITDFSVSGVTSAIVDGAGTSGFFAGGSTAILDVNLIVTPRGGVPAVPPSPLPEAILELPPPAPTQIHDPIVGESGQSTGASQSSDSTQEAAQSGGSGQLSDKDEKKKLAVCS